MEFRQKCWLALVLGSDRGDRGERSEVTELLAGCQTLRVHVCALVYYVLLCCRPWPSDQPPCIPALLIKALCLLLCPTVESLVGKNKDIWTATSHWKRWPLLISSHAVNKSTCPSAVCCAPVSVLILPSLSHFCTPAAAWVELAWRSLIKTAQPANRWLRSPHGGSVRVDWSIFHRGSGGRAACVLAIITCIWT